MDLAETNILHVITRSDWGGAQRIVKLLATGTEANVAVACGTDGKLVDELRTAKIPVYEQVTLQSPPNLETDARALASLYRLLERESFDLIHCHSTKAGVLGRLAARITGTPTMFTVHGWGFHNTDYSRVIPVITRGEKELARITDAIVCVSKNGLIEGRKHGIVQRTESAVVHNGIPLISVSADRRTLYEETDIKPETVIVGAIARLVRQKNPIVIIRTAKELENRGYSVAVVLIGNGPLAEGCERYVDKHGINAHLLGFHEHAYELLRDFDVFLMPSQFEGFPLTMLESFHAGVPIVAYDIGGVAEAIIDGETGFIVEAGDENAFVARTEQLVTDGGKRETMGSRAKTVVATHYTAKRMVRDYEQIYRSVLN